MPQRIPDLWHNLGKGVPRKKENKGQEGQKLKLAEEFCILDGEVRNFKPILQRHAKLRELILAWHEDLPSESEAIVPALTYDIVISSKDQIRSVSLEGKKKLFKLWGANDFIAKSSILLKSLGDLEDEQHRFTIAELRGPRHLHVRGKTAAVEPAA